MAFQKPPHPGLSHGFVPPGKAPGQPVFKDADEQA